MDLSVQAHIRVDRDMMRNYKAKHKRKNQNHFDKTNRASCGEMSSRSWEEKGAMELGLGFCLRMLDLTSNDFPLSE